MSQNKRRKMDLGATSSSASANIQEMSTSVLDDGGEPHNAQQTARAGSASINENEEKDIFDENTDSFREAVKWSGFVDRTMLIKELLLKPTRVIIYAPSRFGKSMNVSMVKCFFEIERGRDVTKVPRDLKELENFENFKAFMRYGDKEPCQILEKVEFVKEHFGRHPVIHLNFLGVQISSIQVVKDSLRQLVHFAYLEHSYLQNGQIFPDSDDNENANKRCRIWCDPEKYEGKDPMGGLQKLIEYLYAYHKREVYLLVDEFDAPIVKAMMARKGEDEVKNISMEITELMVAVLKNNKMNEYLLGSLITGVSHLASIGISDKLNNIKPNKWLLERKGRFIPYYGLSEDELTTLLKQVFPDDEQKRDSIQKEAKVLYNGYTFQNKSVYCLWSVLHYIRDRSTMKATEITKNLFWGPSSIVKKMGSLLKNGNMMSKMIDLINEKDTSFLPYDEVDAGKLANFLKEGGSCNDVSLVFTFFMELGYLTRADKPDVNNEIYVKIPNKEVLAAFHEMFRDFSVNVCLFSEDLMKKCGEDFKNLPTTKDDAIFKSKLKEFHGHLQELLQDFGDLGGVNERALQAALWNAMIKVGFKICCMEHSVKVGPNTGKIDLFLYDGHNVMIKELKVITSDDHKKLKESAKKACDEIIFGSETKKVPYVNIVDEYPDIANYILIGVSMSHNGKVCICCLINSREVEDYLYFPED